MSIGTFGAFTQARLAIYAAQTGITVTGNNISNVNTPGYTRQRLNQVSLYTAGADRYYAEGDVRVGQGALVKNISQIRNPYLDIRFREENAKVGYYDAYTTGLKSMSFLDETGKGDASKNEDGFGLLGLDIMKLYETLQNVNDQTGHQEYDDSVKGIAQSLVTKIHSYAGKLEEVRNDTIHEFNEDIDMVNSYLKTIRELNEEIRKCEIYGDPALELRDERNRQIDELSALIDIDVTYSEEVISPGLSVEKLSISLGNANPDGSVLTDEALLVDGVYSAQLAMKTPVVNLLSGYTDVMPAPGSDEYKLMEETAKELLGKETVTAAEIQELVDGGKYLDKNGKPVDDIRDAKMLTGDDNPNYMFTVTALKNKINEILTITTKFDPQKVSGDDMAMGADGNPSTTSIKDLLGRNKSAIVTIEDQPERGDSTLYVYSYKGKDRNNQDVYTVQEVHQILSKPVALDDNDLGGKLQAQRELLTEEGVFIDKNTIANIDENAGTKRGIGYYQKVLDLLANEFAETLNEANQGFLNDEYGNYMGAELDGDGNPILDDAGSPKGKPIEITANGDTYTLNKKSDWTKDVPAGIKTELLTATGLDQAGNPQTTEALKAMGLTTQNVIDAYLKGQTYNQETGKFEPLNKDDVLNKDGTVAIPGWDGANGTSRMDDLHAVFIGGPLFSNANDSNDVTKITASNINVSAAWTKGSILVRSFECIPGTMEVASGQSDNLTHLKYLVGEKKVDFVPNQLDSSPNASDKVYFNGTFYEMWNDIGGTLGKDQKEAEDLLDTYYQTALSIDTDRDSVSSVDFNDEAMNLMMYSKSYNAACRLMTTIDSVLDKLINGTGMTT